MDRMEARTQLRQLQTEIKKHEQDILALRTRCRQIIQKHGLPMAGADPEDYQQHRRVMGLSLRQLDVVRELAKGKTNHEIAASLFIEEKTVKFHLTDIYKTMQVTNRTQMMALIQTDVGVRQLVLGDMIPKDKDNGTEAAPRLSKGGYRVGNA